MSFADNHCKGNPVWGDCPQMFDGFMFDETLKKCKEFSRVGCGRTPNGFLTEEECENSCGK